MTSNRACPEEAELLALAAGDEPSEQDREHLDGCSDCRRRVDRMRAELSLLRQGRPLDGRLADPIRADPGPEPRSADRLAPHSMS